LAGKSPRSPSTNNKKTELRVSPKSQLRQSLASEETLLKPPWQCWGGSREVVFPQVPTWWKDATATLFCRDSRNKRDTPSWNIEIGIADEIIFQVVSGFHLAEKKSIYWEFPGPIICLSKKQFKSYEFTLRLTVDQPIHRATIQDQQQPSVLPRQVDELPMALLQRGPPDGSCFITPINYI